MRLRKESSFPEVGAHNQGLIQKAPEAVILQERQCQGKQHLQYPSKTAWLTILWRQLRDSVEIAILVTLTGGHNKCLPQQVAEDVLVNFVQGNGTEVNY